VFVDPEKCATYNGPSEAQAGKRYRLAWDIGVKVDNAAVGAMDEDTGETVEVFHWTGVPIPVQLERVAGISRKYNFASVAFDATGIGQTIAHELEKRGVNCIPIHWTNALKDEMVNHLAFLMEQRVISFPPHEALLSELKQYRYTISETGVTRYSAPRGSYDDLVAMMVMLYKDYNQAEMDVPFFGFMGGVQIGGGKRSAFN
jgi:hypothetical protein